MAQVIEDTFDEKLHQLEERGAPQGLWLLEIAKVRNALQDADDLLRRMEKAIVKQAQESGETTGPA